jgi:hypothetical protein
MIAQPRFVAFSVSSHAPKNVPPPVSETSQPAQNIDQEPSTQTISSSSSSSVKNRSSPSITQVDNYKLEIKKV